jgi:hypothetical protein
VCGYAGQTGERGACQDLSGGRCRSVGWVEAGVFASAWEADAEAGGWGRRSLTALLDPDQHAEGDVKFSCGRPSRRLRRM